jgi:hypothetical protein
LEPELGEIHRMIEQLITILDALSPIKLLPRRSSEHDVLYGYVPDLLIQAVTTSLTKELVEHGYEVHLCEWADEIVLLALTTQPQPLAIRLTSSATERYNLYALSRPQNAQALWQWAHAMVRQQVRERRSHQM